MPTNSHRIRDLPVGLGVREKLNDRPQVVGKVLAVRFVHGSVLHE
jgi:hypothetical protein